MFLPASGDSLESLHLQKISKMDLSEKTPFPKDLFGEPRSLIQGTYYRGPTGCGETRRAPIVAVIPSHNPHPLDSLRAKPCKFQISERTSPKISTKCKSGSLFAFLGLNDITEAKWWKLEKSFPVIPRVSFQNNGSDFVPESLPCGPLRGWAATCVYGNLEVKLSSSYM